MTRGRHSGFKHSEETKRKIGLASLGRKLSLENKNKLLLSRLGSHHSKESKLKMRKSRLGMRIPNNSKENHYNWKGDKVKYIGLHVHIRKYLPKPKNGKCVICDDKLIYDVANITGKYNRELINWRWLCRSCHMRLDYKNGIRKGKGK